MWKNQGSINGDNRAGVSIVLDINNDNAYVGANNAGGSHNGGHYQFLKFDLNGNRIWEVTSSVFNGIVRSVNIDKNGNIYVVSYVQTFGGSDGFLIVKHNSSGIVLWSHSVGGGTYGLGYLTKTYGYSAAIDNNDNIYVTGGTTGNVDGVSTRYGPYKVFLLKFDSNGTMLWGRQKDTSVHGIAKSITIDNKGYVYIVGYTNGSIDGIPTLGGYDCFLLKYDSNGLQQ